MDPAGVAVLVVAAGLLLGWAFAAALRRQDHRTFVLARAPQLPIRALAEHDDAWLRGRIVCQDPLVCPWFEVPCVAYSYHVEREVTRTRKDSNGNTVTETSWETVHQDSRTIDFDLDDGARLRIALQQGKNEAMQGTGHDYETSTRRHSAQVLPVGAEVSVLGVLRDDRTFGPMAEVPLLVTAKTREQRVRGSARSEGWQFFAALLFPFAAVATATYVLQDAAGGGSWPVAIACGLGVLVPQWWLLTYNRLVRLRQQVRTAQQQIGIDTAMRFDLVPNLVATVRAAAAHEQQLLASLSSLRAAGAVDATVRAEPATLATTRQVLLLHERYPSLRSDALYRDLHDRLWAIEEKIAHSRSFYNGIVTEWNDRLGKLPSSLVARSTGCRTAPLFAAECAEALPPRLADMTPVSP